MAFSDNKADLVKAGAAVLHDLQTTAIAAGAKVRQVVLDVDPDGTESLVQYTWDVQSGTFDIATLNDDTGGS